MVCAYCSTTLYHRDGVLAAGKRAIVAEPASHLRVGLTGRVGATSVLLVGRVRFEAEGAVWDEWYGETAAGLPVWIVEDGRAYALESAVEPAPPLPVEEVGARFVVDGVEYLVANHGVDPERVGIHGWSFGGFQTQMCLYTEPEVFQVGIAGAGPTEWENYNAWYSTGTIGPSREGATDLEEYSLLPLAKNLEGKLLLVHGMEDSNVLYQDTVRVYRELLKADKEVNVELFLDPTGGHGLGGDVKSIGRYRKYEDFLVRHLGDGEPAPAEEDEDVEEVEDPDADDGD